MALTDLEKKVCSHPLLSFEDRLGRAMCLRCGTVVRKSVTRASFREWLRVQWRLWFPELHR